MTALCSRCKKITPKGEEVEIGSDSNIGKQIVWVGWKFRRLGGKGIFCLSCAKKEKFRRKRFWKDFVNFYISVLLIFLCGAIIIVVIKNNTP